MYNYNYNKNNAYYNYLIGGFVRTRHEPIQVYWLEKYLG